MKSIVRCPPGLSDTEVESATQSRARRRDALAIKLVQNELQSVFMNKFDELFRQVTTIDMKLDELQDNLATDTEHRVARLKALQVMSPTSEEVLSEMLIKAQLRRSLGETSAGLPPQDVVFENDPWISKVDGDNIREANAQVPSPPLVFDIFDLQVSVGTQTCSECPESHPPQNEQGCMTDDIAATLVGDWRALPQDDVSTADTGSESIDEVFGVENKRLSPLFIRSQHNSSTPAALCCSRWSVSRGVYLVAKC